MTIASMTHAIVQAMSGPPPVLWPAGFRSAASDVYFDGCSLTEEAMRFGTPLVRIGSVDQADGIYSTLVVARVVGIRAATAVSLPQVQLDADLDRCDVYESSVRMIGRVGMEKRGRARVHSSGRPSAAEVRLPADIRVGDLVVLVCRGAVPLSDVARPGRTVTEEGDDPPFGVCGR